MARAHRHTLTVKDRADVVGMEVVHSEADRRPTRLRVRGAVHGDAFDVVQRGDHMFKQRDLVCPYRVHPDGSQVLNRGPQADGLRDHRGASLEPIGHLVVAGLIQLHVDDHLATSQERRHRLQHLGPAGQDTHT